MLLTLIISRKAEVRLDVWCIELTSASTMVSTQLTHLEKLLGKTAINMPVIEISMKQFIIRIDSHRISLITSSRD
jgi:hypothetical protein